MFEDLNMAVPQPAPEDPSIPPGADLNPAESEASGAPGARESQYVDSELLAEISPELIDWKSSLRREFEEWLDSIHQVPEPLEQGIDDEPDLYSFYRELAASNVEARKGNRRTAEAFSQWGETLSKFDAELRLVREQQARQPVGQDDSLMRPWCLAQIEVVDRLQRLAIAFRTAPAKRWWINDATWRVAWETQRQALSILLSHTEDLLLRAGITKIPTADQIFDPTTMTAVDTEISAGRPHQSVVEELAAGYRLNGELLRIAEVRISLRPR